MLHSREKGDETLIDLDAAIKRAMLAREQPALTAYRAVKTKAAVKLSEAGRGEDRRELSEAEMTALLRKEIKERQESNEFLAPSHADYGVNQAIIATLETHLPAALSAEETDALVDRVFAEVQPAGPKEMGKVMAALRQADAGLDMGAVSAKVKERLAKLG